MESIRYIGFLYANFQGDREMKRDLAELDGSGGFWFSERQTALVLRVK